MAYLKNPKIYKPKVGRKSKVLETFEEGPIEEMCRRCVISMDNISLPLLGRLQEGWVFRYGRIWENVCGYWCCTPLVPSSMDEVENTGYVSKRGDVREDERDEEFKRIWTTGRWYIVKGVLTWISPWQYGVLNYWNMNLQTVDGKKEYRDKDRRRWLHFAMGYRHPTCLGQNYLKRRRDGATIDGGFMQYWFVMRDKAQNVGMISYNESQARETFEGMVRNPFYELPTWLIPIHSTTAKSDRITLTMPSEKRSAKNYQMRKDDSKKGTITYRATTVRGFDGQQMAFQHINEAGKLGTVSIKSYWNKNKLTLRVGPRKVGFAFMETTCDEMQSGARLYKELYYQGRMDRYKDGSTTSSMWSIFIPAYDGYEGFIGPYGESIIGDPTDEQWEFMKKSGHAKRIGAKQYQEEERKRLENDGAMDDLMEMKRKEPWTEEEAFDSSNTDCHFNMQILSNLKGAIEQAEMEVVVQRGNFKWMDREKTVVGWQADEENGRFWSSWFPPSVELQNQVVKGRNGYAPLNKKMGVIGLDPFNKAIVYDKKRASMGAAYGGLYFDYESEKRNASIKEKTGRNMAGYWPTPCLFLRYHARPTNMSVFYEDILMACWFYGLPLANEAQVNKIEDYFEMRGCSDFLLTTAEMKGGKDVSNDDYSKKGMPMSDGLSWECIELINGILEGNQLYLKGCYYNIWEDVRRFPFIEGVQELIEFDNNNRTVSDGPMALMQFVKAMSGMTDMSNPYLRAPVEMTSVLPDGILRDMGWASTKQEDDEEDLEWMKPVKYRKYSI